MKNWVSATRLERPIFWLGLAIVVAAAASAQQLATRTGQIEHDVVSAYSHIRVRKDASTRTLLFVRDNGEEVVESKVDLKRPQRLLVDYTQYMFLSYAHRPEQRKVLIVGLGGGGMIHFLKHHDPQVAVDVVEIDPAIVKVADQFFQVRSEGNVKIITADGVDYLSTTTERYDVIYMDAFLKPSAATDVNGVPLAAKTAEFYQQVQQKLTPGGLVVFNLNPHDGTRQDIETIAQVFRQTYVYRVPVGGFVAVGTGEARRETLPAIRRLANAADRRLKTNFLGSHAGQLIQQP